MTPPSRKKARPVRKPRAHSLYFRDGPCAASACDDGCFYIRQFLFEPKEAKRLHAWLGKWLAWRADQERRKR